jgi:uncharacterized membrane protein
MEKIMKKLSMGNFVALSPGVGTAFGVAFDNIAIGVALGAAIGAGLGAAVGNKETQDDEL